MARIVSPERDQLDKLRQPMTQGEKRVFEFFDTHLDEAWEIYIQPHLNGLRPDFVLLNPNVGIAVYEVKDWDLNAMSYSMGTDQNGHPNLMAIKDGKEFSIQYENPIDKINLYKQELFNIYCPRLQQGAGFAVITSGVIFPFADDDQLRCLFGDSYKFYRMDQYPQYSPLVGTHALESNNLKEVFPEGARGSSRLMSEDLAKDLRNWLVEPEFSKTQRQPIELDINQRSFVTTRTSSGYRRIRGAAGSGKSLILAARAAELLGQGKKVLVVTFNITLLHYLMDVAVRWPQSNGKTRSGITWLNFHSWCKRVCFEAGYDEEYRDLSKQYSLPDLLNIAIPSLAEKATISPKRVEIEKYDAVLVDEGQDFLPQWWGALRKICKPGGEMVLVADATQDIYETAKSWTDEAMTGAGFSGSWAELEVSYRLPRALMEKASDFAIQFLPQETMNLPKGNQLSLELENCNLRWVHTEEASASEVCFEEILKMSIAEGAEPSAFTDITFLCDSKNIGSLVVKLLNDKKINVINTYHPDDQECRRQKVGFYMGDARIKATTLHSFKGWESKALVLYVGRSVNQKSMALLYTGLTRLKRSVEGSSLTVVSSANELIDYGRSWPSFQQITL